MLPIKEVVCEPKRTSPLSREQPNLADHRALNVRISLAQYSEESYKTVTE